VQAAVLTALVGVPALTCVHFAVVADPDIWWHMRTGQWILQHGGMPPTEPFTRIGAGKPWAAYSWLFELLLLQLFQRFGLAGIVLYTASMVTAITAALFRMNRRLQADFSISILLSFAATFCMMSLWTPRSWLFTVLFFVMETDIVMHARKTGKTGDLYWLPLIFALWANTHIQFVAGLVVLALAVAESVLARWWSGVETRVGAARFGGIFAACIVGAMVNPYGWTIYKVAFDLSAMHGIMSKVGELMAMPFRELDNFGVLFFALAAAAVVARARRVQLFEIALLAFAVMVSFRSQRDIWAVVTVASAILASGLKGQAENRFRVPAIAAPLIAIALGLVIFAGFRIFPLSEDVLSARVAAYFPVDAVNFVKQKELKGPLYNDFNWGGYLIWDLGLPVSMDGRVVIYGDDQIDRSVATWGGAKDWASDPELQKANLVIGPVNAPLVQLLRLSPQFDLAYEDKVAAVFVAREQKR
jgi:hypothetical protein